MQEPIELIEGQWYELNFWKRIDVGTKYKLVKRKMKLLKKYRHHALFVDRNGVRECFGYFELWRLLRGDKPGKGSTER